MIKEEKSSSLCQYKRLTLNLRYLGKTRCRTPFNLLDLAYQAKRPHTVITKREGKEDELFMHKHKLSQILKHVT